VDVIVVGGGPVGLMAAALLDMAGVRVEVFERNDGPSGQSRGSTTHPRTLEVLTMLEAADGRRLSEVLVAQGRRTPRAHFASLPEQLDYRELDTPFPFVLMVAQWRTERALADLLRSRGVRVHYGVAVTEVTQSAEEVRVFADDAWHVARYLIGADGAHSLVRGAAEIDFPGAVPSSVGFVADVQLTEPVASPRHFWNHEFGTASLVPLTGLSARVFGFEAGDVGLTPEQVRRRRDEPLTFEELTAMLQAICGSDLGLHSPTWLSRSTNSARHATSYRSGRIFLVGDAAHVHLPAGGQGLNMGLQDAVNLSWKLAAEVHGWAPERLITGDASYDIERRPVAARLVADTQAQDALTCTFNEANAALRAMFGSFIAQGGEVARHLTRALSGLAVAYPGQEGAHPIIGTRAPDLSLSEGRTLMRTLHPARFTLLDLTPTGSLAPYGNSRVQVLAASRPADPQRAAWRDVQAVLVRPDGYVAHAAADATGLDDALAAWTERGQVPAPVR
jgi:2-polyprenyl-6-methoxyphenol hydroxylase-like FAD-dependent oxidoreductase